MWKNGDFAAESSRRLQTTGAGEGEVLAMPERFGSSKCRSRLPSFSAPAEDRTPSWVNPRSLDRRVVPCMQAWSRGCSASIIQPGGGI